MANSFQIYSNLFMNSINNFLNNYQLKWLEYITTHKFFICKTEIVMWWKLLQTYNLKLTNFHFATILWIRQGAKCSSTSQLSQVRTTLEDSATYVISVLLLLATRGHAWHEKCNVIGRLQQQVQKGHRQRAHRNSIWRILKQTFPKS